MIFVVLSIENDSAKKTVYRKKIQIILGTMENDSTKKTLFTGKKIQFIIGTKENNSTKTALIKLKLPKHRK